MRMLTIVAGAITLVLGGMFLPSLAQPGRTVTRETTTESSDFVRVGPHIVNRSHVAYVGRYGTNTAIYFLGGVPPLYFSEDGDALVAQFVEGNDPNRPQMPDQGHNPFDAEAPTQDRRTRVLPSPGDPIPEMPTPVPLPRDEPRPE